MAQTLLASAKKTQPGSPAESRKRAELHMNEATRKISDAWAKLVVSGNALQLRAKYQQALDIRRVEQDPAQYGDSAIAQLFERHSMSKSSLQDYRNVAERIDKATFSEIESFNQKVVENSKPPISWSHLIALSRLADYEVRIEMAKRVAEEGWDCTTLSENVSRLIAREPSAGVADTGGLIKLQPTKVAAKVEKVAEQFLKAISIAGSDEFLERVNSVQTRDAQKSLEHVRSVSKSLRDIEAALKEQFVTWESAEQLLTHKLSTAGDSVTQRSSKRAEKKSKRTEEESVTATPVPGDEVMPVRRRSVTRKAASKTAVTPGNDGKVRRKKKRKTEEGAPERVLRKVPRRIPSTDK